MVSEDRVELGLGQLELRELLRVEGLGLPQEADALEGQGLGVVFGQLALGLEALVHALAHGRVGAISANQDIATVRSAVRALDNHTLGVLLEGDHLLAHQDVFLGDLAQQQVVQVRTGYNVLIGGAPVFECLRPLMIG